MPSPVALRFVDVDGLAFAAIRGKLQEAVASRVYEARQLGPLLELVQLSTGRRLPSPTGWLSKNETLPLLTALEGGVGFWISQSDRKMGFIRNTRSGGDHRFTDFLMRAKRAGRNAGLSPDVSGQLVAAMRELHDNIGEHAQAPHTGIVAFRAESGAFEFVVADRGVGVLRSLRRCKEHAGLRDEGTALQTALRDGVSRHGSKGRRGYGFRPIFVGLINLYGELRFRSGDHVVTMDGTGPGIGTSRVSQKVHMDGFFASVRCITASEVKANTQASGGYS